MTEAQRQAKAGLEKLLLKMLADGRRSATQRGVPKAARPEKLARVAAALKRAKEEQ